MNTPNPPTTENTPEKTRLGRNPFERKTSVKPKSSAAAMPPESVASAAPAPASVAAPTTAQAPAPASETKNSTKSEAKSETPNEWETARHWVTVELPAELMMLGLETAITVTRGLRRLNADRIKNKAKKKAEA